MRGLEMEEDEGPKGDRKRQKKKRILEIWTETEGRHNALCE